MLIIRRATQEDRESIWRAHTEAVRVTCASHYSPQVIGAWVERMRPEKYEEAIRSNEFFVAEEDELVVGFGELNQTNGEIQGLYVSPDAGRRGIGLKLLRTLEERARASGLKSLHLTATLNAVSFYERAGFQAQQKLTHILREGIERECISMIKELSIVTEAS